MVSSAQPVKLHSLTATFRQPMKSIASRDFLITTLFTVMFSQSLSRYTKCPPVSCITSLTSFRQTLLRIRADAAMYLPAGKLTMPPPELLACSIALLIAMVSLVFPSPLAPKSFTLNWCDSSIFGCGMAGGVNTLSGGRDPATPWAHDAHRSTSTSRAQVGKRFKGDSLAKGPRGCDE